jgi:hypothetical protein
VLSVGPVQRLKRKNEANYLVTLFLREIRDKYRNLALLVGGVSKLETIKYAHEFRGTQI